MVVVLFMTVVAAGLSLPWSLPPLPAVPAALTLLFGMTILTFCGDGGVSGKLVAMAMGSSGKGNGLLDLTGPVISGAAGGGDGVLDLAPSCAPEFTAAPEAEEESVAVAVAGAAGAGLLDRFLRAAFHAGTSEAELVSVDDEAPLGGHRRDTLLLVVEAVPAEVGLVLLPVLALVGLAALALAFACLFAISASFHAGMLGSAAAAADDDDGEAAGGLFLPVARLFGVVAASALP